MDDAGHDAGAIAPAPPRRRSRTGPVVPPDPAVAVNGSTATVAADHPDRFDRLTPRHRECLRGVRELKGSKEIAEDLGIEKSTVDGYLTEAVKVLGARNRRDAALQLDAHERALHGRLEPSRSADILRDTTPDKMRGHSAGLADPAPILPIVTAPDETPVGLPGGAGDAPSRQSSPGTRLPFRRKGQARNELSIGSRLIWIQLITLGIAIGFGMLMTGLQILTGLIDSVSRHLS